MSVTVTLQFERPINGLFRTADGKQTDLTLDFELWSSETFDVITITEANAPRGGTRSAAV